MRRLLTVLASILATTVALAEEPLPIDLLYEVDAKTNADPELLDELLMKARQRAEPWGFVERRRESLRVHVHDPKHVDEVEHALSGDGSFELRMFASAQGHAEIIARARANQVATVEDANGKCLARWIAVDKKLAADTSRHSDWATRTGDSQELQVLIVDDAHDVTGTVVESVWATRDFQGRSCVTLGLTKDGGKRLSGLGAEIARGPRAGFERPLAIIVRGRVVSTATIKDAAGSYLESVEMFTPDEAETVAKQIAAGAQRLPMKLIRSELARPPGFRRRRAPPPRLS